MTPVGVAANLQKHTSGNVGEIGSVKAGTAKTLNITLKPGHYALICNLPGHYKTGQFADFYVR